MPPPARPLRAPAQPATIGRRMDQDIRVGDEVILMSAAGRFAVVAVDRNVLTLQSDSGVRKRVLVTAVRKVAKASASPA